MDERPGWRRMFDAWNEQMGPRLEQFVRTDAFADQAAWFAELNRQWTQMTEEFSRRLLHAWNIPSASDVLGLKQQLEALDRQLNRLNKTVQEARDANQLKRNACDAYDPTEMARRVQRDMERSFLRFRNGIKLATGLDKPGLGLTPKDTIWTHDKMELWRYRSDDRRFATPVLMVMSLVSRSYIFDLRPGNSLVEYMLGRGFDVFVLDWGVPDHLDADNSLSTYTDDYLPRAVDVVRRTTGSDVITMNGYCFGGVLALLHAAAHPEPIGNLITMATPVDTSAMGPMNTMTAQGRIDPETLIGDDGNVPASVIESGFKMLKPTGEIADYVNLWDNMWNDDFLVSYQAMTTWGRDQIPFPGKAFLENVHLFGRQNLLRTGTVPVGGRPVHLADITCPFLSIVGEKDHIVPLAGAQGLPDLVGSADKTELSVVSGHVGLFVGRSAQKKTLPPLCDWMEARSERVS